MSENQSINIALPEAFTSKYSVVGVLGHGGSGLVVSAIRLVNNSKHQNKTKNNNLNSFLDQQKSNENEDQLYACKIINRSSLKDTSDLIHFEHELRIHSALKHKNIIQIQEVIYGQEMIIIVMDFCEKGDLLKLVSTNHLRCGVLFRKIIFQIIFAVEYLHQKGIVHRDIKPDNVVIDSGFNAKLCDFGCAEDESDQLYELSTKGTFEYVAPEVMNGTAEDLKKTDIFSIGILIFAVLTGTLPSRAEKTRETIENMKKTLENFAPQAYTELFMLCCEIDPIKRASADDLLKLPLFKRDRQTCVKFDSSIKNIKNVKTTSPYFTRSAQKLIITSSSKRKSLVSNKVSKSDYNLLV